jgi:hypothetical protein
VPPLVSKPLPRYGRDFLVIGRVLAVAVRVAGKHLFDAVGMSNEIERAAQSRRSDDKAYYIAVFRYGLLKSAKLITSQ